MSLDISVVLSAIAPQFDAPFDQNVREIHIDMAKPRTAMQWFGADKYPIAVALRAAHTLVLRQHELSFPGSAGTTQSMHEGDQSIAFGKKSTKYGDDYLKMTKYGEDLISLRDGANTTFGIVNKYNPSSGILNINIY